MKIGISHCILTSSLSDLSCRVGSRPGDNYLTRFHFPSRCAPAGYWLFAVDLWSDCFDATAVTHGTRSPSKSLKPECNIINSDVRPSVPESRPVRTTCEMIHVLWSLLRWHRPTLLFLKEYLSNYIQLSSMWIFVSLQ